MTRFEHANEIQQECGLASFVEVEAELAAWITDQARRCAIAVVGASDR